MCVLFFSSCFVFDSIAYCTGVFVFVVLCLILWHNTQVCVCLFLLLFCV